MKKKDKIYVILKLAKELKKEQETHIDSLKRVNRWLEEIIREAENKECEDE